jgi:hypothetical protein
MVVKSEAYDCSFVGDDSSEDEVLPCISGGPSWLMLGNQVKMTCVKTFGCFLAHATTLLQDRNRIRDLDCIRHS